MFEDNSKHSFINLITSIKLNRKKNYLAFDVYGIIITIKD